MVRGRFNAYFIVPEGNLSGIGKYVVEWTVPNGAGGLLSNAIEPLFKAYYGGIPVQGSLEVSEVGLFWRRAAFAELFIEKTPAALKIPRKTIKRARQISGAVEYFYWAAWVFARLRPMKAAFASPTSMRQSA